MVSPLDEVRGALAVFDQILWEALPRYVRQIDRAIGEPLPLDAAPLRFGSWIGGDRDGNPNVTPDSIQPRRRQPVQQAPPREQPGMERRRQGEGAKKQQAPADSENVSKKPG